MKKRCLLLALSIVAMYVSAQQTPLGGTAHPVPGKFEAENYDEGVGGYYDTDHRRTASAFRDPDTLDTEPAGTGIVVGYTRNGEWAEYTCDVAATGVYQVIANQAVPSNPWNQRLAIASDEVVIDTFAAPATGGNWDFSKFVADTLGMIPLTSGTQEIRFSTLCSSQFYANIDWYELRQVASLTEITVNGIALADFEATKTSYTVDLPSATIPTVAATAATGATATVTPVSSLPGATTIAVTGTNMKTLIYTINFTVPGTDATLSAITVNGNAISGFDPATLQYSVVLDYGETVPPVVAATPNDNIAVVSYEQITSMPDTAIITVTARDDVTKLTYKVALPGIQKPYMDVAQIIPGIVEAEKYDEGGEGVAYHDDATRKPDVPTWRVEDKVDVEGNDAFRNVGWTSAGEWLEYIVDVKRTSRYAVWYNVATGTATPGQIVLSVDDTPVDTCSPVSAGGWADYSINVCDTIDLTAGEHLLQVKFMGSVAINLDNLQFYDIDANDDATLSSITANGTAIDGFSPATLSYDVEVSSVPTLVVTTTDANATYETTNATTVPGTATIVVRAEDYITKATYTVNYYLPPSNDATLSGIQVDGTDITGFDPAVMSYDHVLPAGTTSATITATATNDSASVVITSPTEIPGTATIDVTAEDGTTKKQYTVNLTKTSRIESVTAEVVKIYPNPSNGEVSLFSEADILELKVINLTGKIVKDMTNLGSGEITLNLTTLAKGAYVISALTDNKVLTGTILIK